MEKKWKTHATKIRNKSLQLYEKEKGTSLVNIKGNIENVISNLTVGDLEQVITVNDIGDTTQNLESPRTGHNNSC